MGKAIITILDAIHCKANKEARKLILPLLEYKAVAWKRNKFGIKTNTISKSHLITGRPGTSGLFLTGLLPRVQKRKIQINGMENLEKIEPTHNPILKGINLREDQLKALEAVKKYDRGKIIFPTGSGKTVIALGIISMFPDCRVLFLCHTKDLVYQSLGEIKKQFEKKRKIFVIGAGYKTDIKKIRRSKNPIVISTIQSFSKIPSQSYIDYFDITIVDEAHHVNSKNSQYGKVMEHNLSPRRYALTATKPTKEYEVLINEGIFGDVIAELTIEEGITSGIIAKPKINLIPVEYKVKINQKCEGKYKNFYQYGIVENKTRNNAIVDEVIKNIKNKESVLIIIERTDHGLLIQKMLKYKKINAPFVHGATDPKTRKEVKRKIKIKKQKVVICSKVWKEGINIPSLNHIIIAHGMKEEKMVLQALGRGLRTTKNKKTIKISDFLDPYHFLAEHSILRMQIYAKQGWI